VADFFLFLFLLALVFLIIGLIKPTLFNRAFKGGVSRKKIGLIFGGLTLVSFILFGLTTDSNTQSNNIKPKKITKQQQTAGKSKPLGKTTKQSENIKLDLVKVTRVIDGDTIEIEGGRKVRYIGIDTPETVHPSKPVECYGKEASEKNKELVLNKEVRLERDVSETDKYGRLLRYVWFGSLMVNEYLVREGYAMSSSYPPDIKYQERFVKAQREAREKNKGLWGSYCETWGKPTNTLTLKLTVTQAPATKSPSEPYTCNCSKTCPNMSSCEEAYFQLIDCGCSIRDGDDDGVPCENICPGG